VSKALAATCVGGVVKVGDLEVPSPVILSEGVASSSGVLILQGGDAPTYIPKTSPDLKTTLEKISSALSSIASALTAIDGKMAGTNPPAPVAAGDISTISSLQSDLAALMENLK
jgi:hypothetical protein